MHVTGKRKPILKDYATKGQNLSTVDTDTYLGVELLLELIWNKQVERVATKSNRTRGLIRRTINTSSTEIKAVAYKTLV